jgi:hypothetical protein
MKKYDQLQLVTCICALCFQVNHWIRLASTAGPVQINPITMVATPHNLERTVVPCTLMVVWMTSPAQPGFPLSVNRNCGRRRGEFVYLGSTSCNINITAFLRDMYRVGKLLHIKGHPNVKWKSNLSTTCYTSTGNGCIGERMYSCLCA